MFHARVLFLTHKTTTYPKTSEQALQMLLMSSLYIDVYFSDYVQLIICYVSYGNIIVYNPNESMSQ